MKNTKNYEDLYVLGAKSSTNNVLTDYQQVCSITAIRMALENFRNESNKFSFPDLFFNSAISGINECIAHLGCKIVRCED